MRGPTTFRSKTHGSYRRSTGASCGVGDLNESRLPLGSDIRFRSPTAWESYKAYIIGTIIVVSGQLLLIAGLLAQRAETAPRRGNNQGQGGDASNQL